MPRVPALMERTLGCAPSFELLCVPGHGAAKGQPTRCEPAEFEALERNHQPRGWDRPAAGGTAWAFALRQRSLATLAAGSTTEGSCATSSWPVARTDTGEDSSACPVEHLVTVASEEFIPLTRMGGAEIELFRVLLIVWTLDSARISLSLVLPSPLSPTPPAQAPLPSLLLALNLTFRGGLLVLVRSTSERSVAMSSLPAPGMLTSSFLAVRDAPFFVLVDGTGVIEATTRVVACDEAPEVPWAP
mmetsp:Transcript_107705/g.310082  ORF Transcript_107705/g.310082 Transcript_107705/m.310082 type:complete len:245 (+) Transcript_107705:1751-2485(+)